MDTNHKLALYVTYYLSRFNRAGLNNLGYSTWNQAFTDIANKLNVNLHSVKNWRDEFDPIHEDRAGWHQRPMRPSRVRVVQALETMQENEILSIVINILNGKIKEQPNNLSELLAIIPKAEEKESSLLISRVPTGRKAEEIFLKHFAKTSQPVMGTLEDTRDKGCGYDFKIKNKTTYYVEVKGLINESGGILFTSKEWEMARKYKGNFILAVISKVDSEPKVEFIINPAAKLNAKMSITRPVQISWNISEKELKRIGKLTK